METGGITQREIDQQVFDLYDEYCHGRIDRREFLRRAGLLGAAALVLAHGLLPDYARAQTISFTDERIRATYVSYPSPGGTGPTVRGYLVQPAGEGKWPAVLVIHENRGLNPYIEDVARRAGTEGFLTLAPDGLTSLGGYPGNDDDGRALQGKLDQEKLRTDMANGARFLKSHASSTGKLGATGFCWGGGTTNYLAIKAPILVHLAENDARVNGTYAAYEEALKAAGVRYEVHRYPGTQHGFHNNSTPRYDEAAAKLSWERTIAFFKTHLAQKG
jgi:carboxymethylenebutenolidase